MNARIEPDVLATPDCLSVSGVTVRLMDKVLIRSVSAEFFAGQVTAILGPNGAGKSTLMSVLTGQRRPDAGQVLQSKKPLSGHLPAELARVRAWVAQETQVAFDFTVREVVELGRYPHVRHPSPHEPCIVPEAMQATAVDHLAHRALGTLSGGEKARVHLARALAQVWEPIMFSDGREATRWLLLDEPTAALDLQYQHRMLALARRWADHRGVGVVAVLHDLNLALRYADRCVLLCDGDVVASGETAAVLSSPTVAEVWGVQATPATAPGSGGVLQYVYALRNTLQSK